MPDEFIDPYLDERYPVLRNLVGARTYDELRNAEGEHVSVRMGELIEGNPRPMTGTLDDFRMIHQALFQDIYDWAGQTRTVEIRKNREGSEYFLPSSNIGMGIAWAQDELRKDDLLKSMDRDRFVERLAYHYDNYNFIHPFREGNGRVQRLFWTILCHAAGYDLAWREVSGQENDEASRAAAEDLDLSLLKVMFGKISKPCDPRVPLNYGLASAASLPNGR